MPQSIRSIHILRNPHFWVILFLTSLLGIVYYGEYLDFYNWFPFTGDFFTRVYPHDLHRILFLIPMLYAAFIFRLRGAVVISIITGCILLPYSISVSPNDDSVLRTVAFIVIAGLATVLLALSEDHRIRTKREHDFMSVLAGTTNALIAVIDKDGRVTSINNSCTRIFGYSLYEIRGKLLWDVASIPEEAEAIKIIFEKVRDGKATKVCGGYCTGKNGDRRFVVWSNTAIFDNEGLFDSMLSTGIDITQQKQVEEERLLLASIVESSEEAIIGETLDGIISSWNKGAEKLYGYSAGEAIGQSISILVPQEISDDLPNILGKIERGEEIEHYETARVRKDGRLIHVALHISPIRDSSGIITGASAIALDITRRKVAEEENVKLMAELEERVAKRTAELDIINKELESFAYSVSHDLRAPLRGIDGFSQALLEDYGENVDAQGKDYLRRIRNATQQMGSLIDDLLGLSRVTRAQLSSQTVNLSQLAHDIASELQQGEPDRQVTFEIAEGLVVQGDLHLMRLALQNLLANAWKFTGKHPRARIEFGVIKEEGRRVYFVRDDGAGFDMAYADKLFSPFQRLHPASEFEGTGIGLATVQRIIHRHEGSVWAEGKVENGSTFYFTL